MTLDDIKVEESDRAKLREFERCLIDVNVLKHENYTELGELINYFNNKYGPRIFRQLINIINNSFTNK